MEDSFLIWALYMSTSFQMLPNQAFLYLGRYVLWRNMVYVQTFSKYIYGKILNDYNKQ